MEGCWNCKYLYCCHYEEFKGCPKIELAAEGLGVPYKPKNDEWIKKIPFSVYTGLKHIVEKLEPKKVGE